MKTFIEWAFVVILSLILIYLIWAITEKISLPFLILINLVSVIFAVTSKIADSIFLLSKGSKSREIILADSARIYLYSAFGIVPVVIALLSVHYRFLKPVDIGLTFTVVVGASAAWLLISVCMYAYFRGRPLKGSFSDIAFAFIGRKANMTRSGAILFGRMSILLVSVALLFVSSANIIMRSTELGAEAEAQAICNKCLEVK